MDKHISCSFFGAEKQSPEGESKGHLSRPLQISIRELADVRVGIALCLNDKSEE